MNKEISKKILKDIRAALNTQKADLHPPHFDKSDNYALDRCLTSSYVSSVGLEINKFEKSISDFTKAKYSIATVNGTSALHLSLIAIGVKENYEILIPSLSFVAPINAILYCKAIPHFIDVHNDFLGPDINKLEKYLKENTILKKNKLYNKKTKNIIYGILPIHLFGHPSKIDEILQIAKKYRLFVVEDAAEALGSFYKNKHVGTFGDVGILSFNGNKIITTGGGGMVITNNKKLAQKINHVSKTAKLNHPWNYIHDQIGYNYRMPNINAALGLSQLKKLNKYLIIKRKLNKKYNETFENNPYAKIFNEPENCKSNFWFQNIVLNEEFKIYKEQIIKYLNYNGIQCRPAWSMVHMFKYCKDFPKMNLSKTKNLYDRIISIPSNPSK